MRRFRGLALTVAALVAVGCGGDGNGGGGNGPENQAPTANFDDPTCTELNCTFTDASTDPDGNQTIASRQWTFESGTPGTSAEAIQAVAFPASGTYTVTLVVTDDEGATDDFSREVTVTSTQPPPGNQSPVASFTVNCTGLSCSFTDTSVDPDGSIAAWLWDFGEPTSGTNNASDNQNPTHNYTTAEVAEFTVTLTVTDDDGATATTTQTFTVTPPAGLQCDNGGTLASCTLNLTSKSTLTITMTSNDCELGGNRLRIISPVVRTVFFNGCAVPPGTVVAITGPNPDGSFEAGTQIQAEFTQGAGDPDDPPRQPPQIRLDGTFPTWTINIDDGGDAGNPRDFDDIVLTAQATTVP